MKLPQKVLAFSLPVAVVAGAVVVNVSLRATEAIMVREAARRVSTQAQDAARRMAPAVVGGREAKILPFVQEVQAFSGADYAEALSPDGVVLAHTNVLEKGRRRSDAAARRALAATGPFDARVEEDGRRRLLVAVPVWRPEDEFLLEGHDRSRAGTLLLSLPLDATLESAARVGARVALLTALFCAAALAAALLLLRALLRRLRSVVDAVALVAGGRYGVLVPQSSSDEIGELAGAFNAMSGALAKTVVSRDRMEEALSIARATLEASADGILVIGSDLRVVDFNRRFLEMWDFEEAVVRTCDSRSLADIAATQLENPDAFMARTTHSYSDYEAGERRDLLHRKDGKVYERVSRPYRRDGVAVGRTMTFRDLTPILETERLKTRFLANVSHELRTPLNAVIGAAGLLGGTELDAGQRESVETLSRATRSLLALVDDVLDFSKIESSRMTVERVRLSPAALLSDAAALVAPAAAAKGLTVRVDCAGAEDLTLLGDSTRVRQILVNLLSNAVKFTESGEIVATLRAAPEDERSVALEYAVTDTGVGITPEQGRRLFAPFTQAEGSTTRRFGGTGLGLAISKSLATLMGGDLDFDSEPGRGTRFRLRLNLDRATAAAPRPAAPAAFPHPAPPRDRLRVLVIEDNATNRRLTARQLERLGCPAEAIPDGNSALARLREREFGLVLMDCQMPGLDGWETTLALRGMEAGRRRVPVVAFTANTAGIDRRRATEVGMDDFLPKPVTLEALAAALDRWDQPYDETALASYLALAGDGPSSRARLLGEFLDDASARLSGCRDALARGDRATAAREAHTLKGAAAAVGARGLRELALRLEESAALPDAPTDSLLTQAAAELERARRRSS